VRRATDPDDPDSFEALSKLYEVYCYPLYAYVREEEASPEDAAEEVQGFFSALLEHDYLASADREKGRLRTFLLDALRKYRAKEHRARQAKKRGGGRLKLSIDQELAEGRFEVEPIDDCTPEQILDRCWARALLDSVLDKLGIRFREQGKEKEFQVLRSFLNRDAGTIRYAEAAEKLGITEANLKVRVHRLRARYRHRLREEVRQTLVRAEPELVEEELRHLLAAAG